jgi:predicted O-methyltransferase YrrM
MILDAGRKAALLAVRLAAVAVRNPERLSHVLGSALAASAEVRDPTADLLVFEQVTMDELLPAIHEERAILALFPRAHASVAVVEFLALVLLLKRAKAKHVFEFGTYKGVSITQLALNVPADGRVMTLDLPEGQTKTQFGIPDTEDSTIAFEREKGALVPEDLRRRIEFLKADSARFDEKPYEGKMDFVFVDGAHSADYVRNDSEKGWRMLRGGGIIAWHDCRPDDPAVVRYLLRSSFCPKRIVGTSICFAEKPC